MNETKRDPPAQKGDCTCLINRRMKDENFDTRFMTQF